MFSQGEVVESMFSSLMSEYKEVYQKDICSLLVSQNVKK